MTANHPAEGFEIKEAKRAHEIFMVGLGGQLLLGPAAIFLQVGRIAILLPLLFSLLFAIYQWRVFKRLIIEQQPAFIVTHWQLALHRYIPLGIGYLITILFLLLSWWLAGVFDPSSPNKFLAVAISRIGVLPVIVMIFVTLVMENMGLNMALRGEEPGPLSTSR